MEGIMQVMSRQSDSNGPMKYEIDVGTINQVIYGRIKEDDDVRVCLMLDAMSLDSKDIVKEDFKEKFYFPNIEKSLEFIEVIKYVHNFLPKGVLEDELALLEIQKYHKREHLFAIEQATRS